MQSYVYTHTHIHIYIHIYIYIHIIYTYIYIYIYNTWLIFGTKKILSYISSWRDSQWLLIVIVRSCLVDINPMLIAATSSNSPFFQRERRFSNTRKYCSYSVAQCRDVYRSVVPPMLNRCLAGYMFTTTASCA